MFPNPACASAANNPAAPFGDIGVALACVNGDGTTSATPDTINVAPSILYPYGGCFLDVQGNVRINGQAGSTVIDAGQATCTIPSQAMRTEAGVTVSLSGLAIAHGIACRFSSCIGHGGAIDNFGTLAISHSTLSNNTACSSSCCSYGVGEAIANGGTLSITNSTLGGTSGAAGNVACSVGACQLAFSGALYNVSTTAVTLTNDTITCNAAGGPTGSSAGGGGGIYNAYGSPILTNDTITSNTPDNCLPLNSLAGCTD